MNALTGSVRIIPVNEYTIWYKSASFPTISTDAVLVDGDGELLLINPGWGFKIISVQQVNRIVTHKVAEAENLNAEEIRQYDDFWKDR